jgi:zinc protease
MLRAVKKQLVGLWALACAAGCGADERPTPPLDFEVALEREQLANGLEVVVLPDGASPVATVIATFRAGALVETPETSGHSHLLEHMMFEGSAELPDPRAFRDELRRLGALTNATTGSDRVNFFYTLPREHLREGAAMMADALSAPALDQGSLQKEIAVVLSEFDLAESDWTAVQRRRLYALLFPEQPTRRDPLGARDVVSAATRERLLAMHAAYYVPNNAMLAIAGAVSGDQGLALARELFGDWPAAPDPFVAQPIAEVAPLSMDAAEVMAAPVSQATLMVAWRGPGTRRDRKAAVVADVLAELSTVSNYGFRSIVGAPTVIGARILVDRAPDASVLMAELVIGARNERTAVDRLRLALEKLAHADSFEDGVLETAIDSIWSERFRDADSPVRVAHRVSNDWGAADLAFHEDYLDLLYSVTEQDVRALVDEYMLSRPHVAVLSTSSDAQVSGSLDAAWLGGAL